MPLAGPKPDAHLLVDELVRAGVSRQTALAMEGHKAREILDLLTPVRIAPAGGAHDASAVASDRVTI